VCTGGGGVRQQCLPPTLRCCPLPHAASRCTSSYVPHTTGLVAGVKHSTHVVRGPTCPSPDSTRGGIEVHRVLRVSTSLSTTSNTRHGQTLHNNTLGAAFHGSTAMHGIKPMGGNGVCPHALTLRWHRGHVCNPRDRRVRSTMDGATEAARWVGAGGVVRGMATGAAWG
jgi:hypothetical protein